MKSVMSKTTFREIKQSFGRFFAIFAIVALGVGFFAGIKVTKGAMIATTESYFEKHQLFDYRLLSTLGFEEEDVSYLMEKPEVRNAKGAVSLDILYEQDSGNEMVIRAHSLTEGLNGVELTAGSMPQAADECVVDSNLFTNEQIGDKIVLASGNDEEDKDNFTYSEYTITGIVNASYYIQFERGTTSLGTGQVSGFMYLLPEGFTVDYYTEIFVKFDEDYPIYSAEYDDFIDEKEAEWEEYGQEAADRRYTDILAEANQELDDAREELADKKEEAGEELADAKQEIEDADVKLSDGEQKIADAQKEMKDAAVTIAEKEQELKDAEVTLKENEETLLQKEQELIDGQKQYDDNNYIVEKSKGELGESQAALDVQKEQIRGQAELLAAKESELVQGEEALDQQEEEWKNQNGGILAPDKEATVAAMRQYFSEIRIQIEAGKAQIASGEQVIAGYQAQLDKGSASLKKADKELGEALKKLQDGREQIEDGKQEIADAKVEIADGWVKLEEGKGELKDGKRELEENKIELADARIEYEDGLKEYEDAYEEFQVQISDAEQEIADAQEEVDDIEEPDTYVLGRKTNIGYVCLDSDSNIVAGIANVFPIFFFLVAALVCITTMNRMVEEQRTQIGVLKALGYKESVIMSKYLFYSGSAAFTGCISGFALGTYFLPRIIWTAYGMMYKVTSLEYLFDWPLALISLTVSLICSMGTTWLSCRMELAEAAAELMRPKAPKAGKRVLFEYITPLWKRLKFLQKVSVRNIFRYKKRFFMMIIGISGCTALLVTGLGVKDSVSNVATQQFQEIQVYDLGVTFKEELNEGTVDKFEAVLKNRTADLTYVSEKAMELRNEEKMKSINLIVVQDTEAIEHFLKLHTEKKEIIPFPGKGEVVISHKVANKLDIRIGDQIVLQDDEMRQMKVKVSGINENFVYDYVYMNEETYWNGIKEAPQYKSAYINLAEDVDAHQLAADLMKLTNVSTATVNADTEERFSSMMFSLNYIVAVVMLCAAGLAFIVLYNLTNINITERIREIATIKVLGFYKRETASYVFRENIVLTVFGSGLGLLLGYFLHQYVMYEINVDMIAFDTHIEPVSYLLSILLTFAFAWFVNLFMSYKLEKINMAESLKSVD